MSKWNLLPLGKLSKMRRGASPRPIDNPEFFSDEGRGWIRIADLAKTEKYLLYTSQYLSPKGVSCSVKVDPGDLIISICATIGKPIIVSIPACIHDGFVHLFDYPNCDRDFLYYFLQGNRSKILASAQTGTQGNLNTDILRKFVGLFPEDPHEQSKIAEVLSAIDVVIEKTKAIIAKYQKIKEGMLQDLLTNGIDEQGQIRSPKTHKYKPSKLGMIPVEWECIQLDHAAKIFSGSTPSTANDANWNGNIVWLTPADLSMVKYQYVCDSERHITPTGLSNSTNRLLPMGSLILSTRAPVGYCAIVQMEFSFNQGCKGLVPFQYIDPLCLYYVLTIQKKAFERFSSGTTFLELPKKELARFLLKMPKRNETGLCEQRKISLKLQQIDAVIERYDETLAKLELQKQGLMQDLLTNTVSVEPLLKKGGRAK